MDLLNKCILITGATSGIGKEIAIECSKNGAKLILTGRSLSKLSDLEKTLGSSHQFIQADLTTDEGIDQILSQSIDLDGVVFSAGIMNTLPAKFITRSALDQIMNINFTSSALLTAGLTKQKKITKGASLVFISSIGGNVIASKGNSIYSASKGAINAFAKVLSLELAPSKIRVNTLNPGMVKTEMWNSENTSISDEQLKEDEKKYPLGYGEKIDVAHATVFLLSEKAKWITGSNIVLDGGFSIQ